MQFKKRPFLVSQQFRTQTKTIFAAKLSIKAKRAKYQENLVWLFSVLFGSFLLPFDEMDVF